MSWIKKHKILSLTLCLCIFFPFSFIISKNKKINDKSTHFISKGSIMECVYGIGTVTSNKSYELKTGITGKVNNIFVKEGDYVEKGDKLTELETIFTAPFSGTVTFISCHEGETVFPTCVILKLTDLLDRYITVVLDQKSVLRISKEQKVKLSFDTLRDKVYEGKIAAIYPVDNKFNVRIDIPELPSQILPGMTADVAIEIKEHSDILMVPITAIDKDKVFVKDENKKLQPVTVQIGITDGIMAEITSSTLKEGDELFIHTPLGTK